MRWAQPSSSAELARVGWSQLGSSFVRSQLPDWLWASWSKVAQMEWVVSLALSSWRLAWAYSHRGQGKISQNWEERFKVSWGPASALMRWHLAALHWKTYVKDWKGARETTLTLDRRIEFCSYFCNPPWETTEVVQGSSRCKFGVRISRILPFTAY